MKITCQLPASQETFEVDWWQWFRTRSYLKVSLSSDLPVQLEDGQFMRVWDRGNVVFEGYVSGSKERGFKLLSYAEFKYRQSQ